MEQEDYSVEYKCDNCSNISFHTIPKGIKVRSFLYKTVCKECDCDLVKKRIKWESKKKKEYLKE